MKTIKAGIPISVRKNRINVWNYLGWMFILSFSLYFIYTHALNYFDLANSVYTDGPTGKKPFTPFLIIHIAFGIIALLSGPLQFFSTIRKKYPLTHRTIGKIYLVSIFISGIAAIYLSIALIILTRQEFTGGTGILGLAIAWFVTSGMALWAIKNRNFLQHQEWMIRSYVVTSGFTIFRLMYNTVTGFGDLPYEAELGGVIAWACWAIPLLITEVILQAKKIHAPSKKPQQHQVAY